MATITTLRAQYDGRKCHWRIVRKTHNGCGGWKKFGSADGYVLKSHAERTIDRLVRDYPDQYIKEPDITVTKKS